MMRQECGSTKNINGKTFNLMADMPTPTGAKQRDTSFNRQRDAGGDGKRERASSLQHQRRMNEDIMFGDSKNENSSTISGRPKNVINYGERLYQKGLKRKEELHRQIREVKNYQDQVASNQFTFKPEINETSKILGQRKEKTEEALIKYGQQVREKVEQLRCEIIFKEQAECKFKPEISKKSEKILSERYDHGVPYQEVGKPPLMDKFSTLYEDAKRRKERHEKIYQNCVEAECTFQPDLNPTKCYNSRVAGSNERDSSFQGNREGNSFSRDKIH